MVRHDRPIITARGAQPPRWKERGILIGWNARALEKKAKRSWAGISSLRALQLGR